MDNGARRALSKGGKSLLAAGVVRHEGAFAAGEAIDIADPEGDTFAKGLAAIDADGLQATAGLRSDQLPEGLHPLVVHRDDLIVLEQ